MGILKWLKPQNLLFTPNAQSGLNHLKEFKILAIDIETVLLYNLFSFTANKVMRAESNNEPAIKI